MAYGQTMTAHTGGMLYGIAQALTINGINSQCLWFSMCDVVEARNVFLTRWYDTHPEHTHVLFIDADNHAHPQLILDMLMVNKDVVGALYRNREQNLDDAQAMIGHIKQGEQTVLRLRGEDQTGFFLNVDHVGGGFMLIKREAITTLLEKSPEISDVAEVGMREKAGVTRVIRAFEKMRDPIGQQLSEDYAFCERILRAGGEVWASIGHKIDHIGPANYPFRFLDHVSFGESE